MLSQYRQKDPVILIYQDNIKKCVYVHEINEHATKWLHYSARELAGKSLEELLPARIRKLISEYVEYEFDGRDVGDVLKKAQNFAIITKDGEEISCALKITRSESLDGSDYFSLVLHRSDIDKEHEAFRTMLKENMRGHQVIDEATGLPDRDSLVKDIDLVHYYINQEKLTASLAVITLDAVPGEALNPAAFLKHVAHIATQNLRDDDVVCVINSEQIGLLLLDTDAKSAKLVLNRLRWLIASSPYRATENAAISITVSIGFTTILPGSEPKRLLQDVLRYVESNVVTEHNTVVELPN